MLILFQETLKACSLTTTKEARYFLHFTDMETDTLNCEVT